MLIMNLMIIFKFCELTPVPVDTVCTCVMCTCGHDDHDSYDIGYSDTGG